MMSNIGNVFLENRCKPCGYWFAAELGFVIFK
jgi:hypothetical protein